MAVVGKKIKKQAGFSLVEVLLAVSLVSIGLVSSMQLLTQGLAESLGSRDQSIASGLAQEGIELVRNVRDNNWATGAASSFSHINESGAAFCRIDKDYAYPANINCGSHLRLNTDANGFYVHTGTTAKFYRKLLITNDVDGNKNIVSMVTWTGAPILNIQKSDCTLQNRCVFVEATLTKWAE